MEWDAGAVVGNKFARNLCLCPGPYGAIWPGPFWAQGPADAMPEEIAALLEKTLAVEVGERPATVMDVLEMLGAADEDGDLYRDMSDAVGGAALPGIGEV